MRLRPQDSARNQLPREEEEKERHRAVADDAPKRPAAEEEEQRLADLRERRQVADAPKLKREREDKEGEDINLISRVSSRSTAKAGDTIKIAIDSSRMHFFDKETGVNYTEM